MIFYSFDELAAFLMICCSFDDFLQPWWLAAVLLIFYSFDDLLDAL